MKKHQSVILNIAISAIVTAILGGIVGTCVLVQSAYAAAAAIDSIVERKPAFIGTSGSNVYVTWSSNKTGNWEIMFKASTDSGKTLGPKINLSNDTSRSVDPQIAASGNNVYVTWWERNATSNEPVMRVSTDNGKTFGEKIMLSAK